MFHPEAFYQETVKICLLFNLQRRSQATLILVTHDVSLAERCGRVVRMADGRIERELAPA